jgi:hypothetical protein
MSAVSSLASLQRQLSARGERVIVRRGNVDVPTLAMVRMLSATEMRQSPSGAYMKYRAVLSPIGLEAILPLRKTDKIVRSGQEREIDAPDHKEAGGRIIRINLDFAG